MLVKGLVVEKGKGKREKGKACLGDFENCRGHRKLRALRARHVVQIKLVVVNAGKLQRFLERNSCEP